LFGEVGILVALLTAPLAMGALSMPLLVHFVWRPPRRWWVTTRRLIVDQKDALQIFSLAELSHIKARTGHQVSVTVDGNRILLSPVFAVAELWGAVVTGKTLASVSFPTPVKGAAQPTVGETICWHSQVFERGGNRTFGVVVLRRDGISWIPLSKGWAGDQIMHAFDRMGSLLFGVSAASIKPIPPTDSLFFQLLRSPSEAAFVTAIDALTHAMNGRTLAPDTGRLNAAGHTVCFPVDDGELRVTRIQHPDWPAVRESLGLTSD